MQRHRSLLLLVVVVGLTTISGASCPRMVYQATGRPVLPPSPSLEQVVEAVNRNNSQIQSFGTTDAEVSSSDMPGSLRGGFAFQRPRRLRFRGGTLVTGPELDLGSNDELFWVWLRRSPEPALYYCRHDRFATSSIRRMIPIDPDWLVEALGIGELDPALPHQGPFPLRGGGLEIRTIRETADGPLTKITVVDDTKALILGQHLFDSQGRLIASAVASEHRSDPVTGLTMAKKIEIRCPSAQFTMRLDLGGVRINRLAGDPQELWNMPRYDNCPLVDLSDPNLQLQPSAAQGPPPATVPPPSMSQRGRPAERPRARPSY